MLVIVANRIACASLVGPSHAATTRGCPSASSRLMASPATTGSSTSKPERDDQRRDRNLLQVDPEHVHEAERHRQRDRNRQRHQQRRAPLPETDQRNQNHQRDRFVEASMNRLDILFHLPRLVGGSHNHQIARQQLPARLASFSSMFSPNFGICSPERMKIAR